MIHVKNQLPNIYYDASRDFQILGHLYEVILNYVKTNADMLYLLPNKLEADTRTTELLATTLGFKLRRNYDKEQLAALVSIFPQLLKIKGTQQAIDLAGNALVKASGVPGTFSSEIEDHVLTIKIPIELSDITLFIDLLPYILPFGLRVAIVRTSVILQEAALPIGASSVVRMVKPSTEDTTDGLEKFLPHPLGLVKFIEDSLEDSLHVDYSKSYDFIDTNAHAAIPGTFGTSPVIAFEPKESSLYTNSADKEDTV